MPKFWGAAGGINTQDLVIVSAGLHQLSRPTYSVIGTCTPTSGALYVYTGKWPKLYVRHLFCWGGDDGVILQERPHQQLGRVGRHVTVLVQLQTRRKRPVHLQKCETTRYPRQVKKHFFFISIFPTFIWCQCLGRLITSMQPGWVHPLFSCA